MKLSFVFSYLTLWQCIAGENRESLFRDNNVIKSNSVRSLQVGMVGRVTRFRLMNATVGNKGQALLDPIVNGTFVNLANYPTGQLFSVEAVTSNISGPVGSVQFTFNAVTNFLTESASPYSLCRDDGGAFRPCSQLVVGSHTIGAIPYSLAKATGVKGLHSSVTFSIVSSPVVAPIATPVKAPTPVVAPIPIVAPKATPVVLPTPVAVPKSTPVTAPTPISSPKATPVVVPTPIAPTSTTLAKWVQVNPSAPINARHEACFLMVGRKAYLLAGRGRQAVNIYDPVTRTWTNGTAPPIQIHHTQCIAVNDSIWIVSSWTGGYPKEKNTNNTYVYNTLTDSWSTKTGLPENRRRGGAAAVLVGDKIYVSHGNRGGHETSNHSTSLGWLDYYDISEDRWYTNLTDAPNPRDHVGGGLINGRICVAGGRDGGDIDFFRKVILPTDCYNPVTNTWSEEASIPAGRAGASYGTTCDGKLMVAGGEGGSNTDNKQAWANVDVFDGTSWTSVANLNVARHGSGLAVDCSCNQIHIASGAKTQGGRYEITSVETLFPNGVDAQCTA